jgi:uncharacterized protein (DUF1499 family)
MYRKHINQGLSLSREAENDVAGYSVLRKGCLLLLCFALMLAQCSGDRPMKLGVTDGQLAPCPSSPNCVSSQSNDKRHAIEPFRYQTALGEARERLLAILKGMPRTKVIAVKDDYVHAEFRSRLFGFVDDVEFSFDGDHQTIHLRSASRTGGYDFGVNRKRVEGIRAQFSDMEKSSSLRRSR